MPITEPPGVVIFFNLVSIRVCLSDGPNSGLLLGFWTCFKGYLCQKKEHNVAEIA